MSRASPPQPEPAHAHGPHDGHDHGGHDHGGHDPGGHEHGDGHNHQHDLKALGQRALLVALVLNGVFLVVEGAVGFATGSLALLSDAVHMFTDVAALSVAFAAASIRSRPARGSATYGHGRVAVLGGLANASLSLVAAAVIVKEALERIESPPVVPGLPVLLTAAIGLLVNLVSAWWLHRSGDKGVNMRGALVHMLGDALGSVAAIVAGATLLMGGPLIVDAVASIVVAAIVAGSAMPLMRDVVHILLERAPRGLDLERVRGLLRERPEVAGVIGLHAWALDDGETVASFVLTTSEPDLGRLATAADAIREQLQSALGIVHATIEWRPVDQARACCDEPQDQAQKAETHAEKDDHGHHRHQPAA